MSEQEHRRLIDEHNAPLVAHNKTIAKGKGKKTLLQPYLKTCPAGYFHAEVLQTCSDITLVEGPFDGLACLAAGVMNVLATCGTALDGTLIPVRICNVTLGYDGDEKGQAAAKDAYKKLRELGITPRIRTPPADDGRGKDWSERYRLHGRTIGLAPLVEVFECSVCGLDLNNPEVEACLDEQGIAFCSEHCPCPLHNQHVPDALCSRTQDQFVTIVSTIAPEAIK